MAVLIKRTPIGGGQTDISSSIIWTSINLNLVLTKEVSTLNFDVLKTPSAVIPVVSDQIDVYDDSGHIFGGTVTESELTIDGGIQARYSITVTDWSYQFDAQSIAKTYTNMDPGDIVADIIANFTTGFTGANVASAGYTIPSIKFNYQPPTKCLQKIAQLIGWDWYIDPDRDVHFFLGDIDNGAGGGVLAPFNLDDVSGNFEWPSIDYTVNSQNLKNSVTVVGATYKKTYTALTAIDVYTSVNNVVTYPLVYPYDKSTIVVTLGGVSQTIGSYGIDDPGSFDVLYSNASGTQPFLVFSANPGDGSQIKVYGDANVPILAYSNDAVSITAYSEFEDTIVDKQITTVSEAQQRAIAEIIQYGQPITDLQFKTLKTGLMIGQTITLNSTILGINVTLAIKRIQAVGYSPTQLEYQVEAIGGDKVRFTDLMAVLLEQELNQNSVDDTTVLQVLLRIAETLTLSDGTPTIFSSSGPYVWGAGWDWRVPITVNHGKVGGAGTISGFPVYVDLSTLPAAFFNGGLDEHGVFHAGVKSDGSDIRVYLADNATQCPVEVVAIDTTAKTGEVWFKGDVSAASDTTFYLWFGNASATMPAATDTYGKQNVWSDYEAVFHLQGNGSDATSHAKTLTNSGMVYGAEKIQQGAYQDSDGDDLRTISGTYSDSSLTRRISLWMKTGMATSGGRQVWRLRDDSGNEAYRLYLEQNTGFPFVWVVDSGGVGGQAIKPSVNVCDGAYHRMTVQYKSSDNKVDMYIDGTKYTGAAARIPRASTLLILADASLLEGGGAHIDETRTELISTTQALEFTEYNNQSAPSTFYTVGAIGLAIPKQLVWGFGSWS